MLASIKDLVVTYGSFTALRGLTADIPEGCIGLLGPNGAGKTTLIKTILGFVKPASGSANILGHTLEEDGRLLRQKIGLMPEQECHIPGLSAVSLVTYAGELCGMPSSEALRRAHEVLELCGLGEARYRLVETFSTGMKQRAKLAQALVHGPKLLLLDEPTNGLDPSGREDMLELIRSVSHGKGLSVMVSSHLLPDIERTCDHVVVVVGGVVRANAPITELKLLAGDRYDFELRERHQGFEQALGAQGVVWEHLKFTSYRAVIPGGTAHANQLLLRIARETGAQLRGFQPAERSLQEAFIDTVYQPA